MDLQCYSITEIQQSLQMRLLRNLYAILADCWWQTYSVNDLIFMIFNIVIVFFLLLNFKIDNINVTSYNATLLR